MLTYQTKLCDSTKEDLRLIFRNTYDREPSKAELETFEHYLHLIRNIEAMAEQELLLNEGRN